MPRILRGASHSRVFRLSGYHSHSTVCKAKQKPQTQLTSSKNQFPVQKISSKLNCRRAEVHWYNRSQVWFWSFLWRTGWGGSELAALSEVLRCVSDSLVKLELSAVGWESGRSWWLKLCLGSWERKQRHGRKPKWCTEGKPVPSLLKGPFIMGTKLDSFCWRTVVFCLKLGFIVTLLIIHPDRGLLVALF